MESTGDAVANMASLSGSLVLPLLLLATAGGLPDDPEGRLEPRQ